MTEIQKLEADISEKQAKVEMLSKQLKDAEKTGDETAIKNAQKKLDKEYELLDSAKDRLKVESLILKSINSQVSTFTRLGKTVKEKLAGDAKSATFLKEQLITIGKLKAEQQLILEAGGQNNEVLDMRLDYFQDLTSEIITQAKENEALAQKLKGQTELEAEKLKITEGYSNLRAELNKEIQDELNKTNKTLSLTQIKAGFGGAELKQKALLLEGLDEEEQRIQELVNLKHNQINAGLRLQEIEDQQQSLLSELPEPIQQSITFAKKLGVAMKAGFAPLLIAGALFAATMKSFSDLDTAAQEFRETTGLTNSQMEGIKSQANDIVGNFSNLGVEAKDVFNTVAALKTEFSDVSDFSDEVVTGLTVLNKNFGVSADSAAKTQAILENIGGLSSETATSVQIQVAEMAKLAGVAPSKVIEDIAENAEIASTFFKGDINALAKAAVEARRLGTNIAKTAEIAEGLLDFESGITKELEASALLGTSINFNKARGLAFDGDTLGATKEVLNQIRSIGDFQSMNYFQQKAIADASGMTVEEITKQLNIQQKLNSLSSEERALAEQAISQGLDISNINKQDLATQIQTFSKQQEQQAVLEQLSNQFLSIASTVGSVLTPLLGALIPILELVLTPVQMISQAFAGIKDIINSIFDPTTSLKDIFAEMGPIASGIAVSLTIAGAAVLGSLVPGLIRAGVAAAAQLPTLISTAVAAITSASAMTLGVGTIAIIGGIVAAVAAMKSAQNVGDMFSPADGKTRVSTKEGGLFELSPNDDLVAAPGAASALAGVRGTLSENNNIPNINNVIGNLSAPLTAVVNEIRGLREDMVSGKIAVYMDGKKVTAGITKVVTTSGQNSYVRA